MTTRATEADRAAAATLLRMISGIHISRCVYAVAELGIADLLAGGPVSSNELARATASHEPSLYRVLRALAALGLFEEHNSRTFGLTAVGERLRRDAPLGMRSWAIFREARGGVRPFEHILETVRTGKPGFDIECGHGVFEFVSQDPEAAAVHDAAMSERTAAFAPSVADTYDFSDVRTLVDVGGGKGTLLAEILDGTRTCTEYYSRSLRWQPGPGRCSTRSTPIAGKWLPVTSSSGSPRGRTAT